MELFLRLPGLASTKVAALSVRFFYKWRSDPKNIILIEQDLTAWATVVHHAVLDGVGSLMKKLGQDPSKLRRGSKGVLEVW